MTFKTRTFKNALSYLNRTTVQFQLIIEKHQKVLLVIRSALPVTLANKAQDCVVKDKKLLIFTASAAWASQLRFYSETIRIAVNSNCNESVEKIQLKVLNTMASTSQVKPSLNIPSMETIELLKINQLNAPDSDLKRALLKLSQTLKKLRHV